MLGRGCFGEAGQLFATVIIIIASGRNPRWTQQAFSNYFFFRQQQHNYRAKPQTLVYLVL
jgi:hypothetical protein